MTKVWQRSLQQGGQPKSIGHAQVHETRWVSSHGAERAARTLLESPGNQQRFLVMEKRQMSECSWGKARRRIQRITSFSVSTFSPWKGYGADPLGSRFQAHKGQESDLELTADIYQGQIMLYPPVFPLWCDDCLSGQGQSSRCWLQEDFWHIVLTTKWVRYWQQKWTVRWAKVWLDLWVQRFVKSSTNGVPLG